MHVSPARRGRRRTLAVGVAIAAAISLTGVSTAGAVGPTLAGANNPNCKLTAAHPRPVVLVHATLSNQQQNWSTLGPQLMQQGYCVWALNYGVTALSLGGTVDGLGDITQSAGQLRDFVNHVLATTGASQVDMVGHSQGGLMPNYYIKRLGGASKVHIFVSLAPSNHGTNADGLVNLLAAFRPLIDVTLTLAQAPSLPEQEVGSAFETNLFRDGDTVAGPKYWVIETSHDEVVTPFTQAFLNGATNILLQNQCPNDPVAHIGMSSDQPALADVRNALAGGSASFKPTCSGFGPAI
jgi:pimeloyl-ACP methyl ester carboxylesterase